MRISKKLRIFFLVKDNIILIISDKPLWQDCFIVKDAYFLSQRISWHIMPGLSDFEPSTRAVPRDVVIGGEGLQWQGPPLSAPQLSPLKLFHSGDMFVI